MKKLALFFTVVFLVGATVSAKTTNAFEANYSISNFNRGYGNSFIFTEGGIEFSVFPDGQFDFYAPNYGPDANASINTPNAYFSFNNGYDYNPYVQYDDFGAIIQIENTPIYYDYYGRVTQVGNVDINYNNYGRVARVGGLYVHYNSYRTFTHYTGYINGYNRMYVYRPWHSYYAVPAPDFCIVYARPYRQYYNPVRHYYYRPYNNNYREPVRYSHHYNGRNASGHRGTVANTSRASDRYSQESSPSRSNAVTNRDNSRIDQTNSFRGAERISNNDRAANTSRLNQSDSSSGNLGEIQGATTRLNESTRSLTNDRNTRSSTNIGGQGSRAVSSDRTTRAVTTSENQGNRPTATNRNIGTTTQRSLNQMSRPQSVQSTNSSRNTMAVPISARNVKSMPKGKPEASNSRTSSNEQ